MSIDLPYLADAVVDIDLPIQFVDGTEDGVRSRVAEVALGGAARSLLISRPQEKQPGVANEIPSRVYIAT